jgi:hypothetical protein
LGTISAFAIRHRETKKKTCAEMAGQSSTFRILTASQQPGGDRVSKICGPGSSVVIATRYWLYGPGSNPGGWERFSPSVKTGPGTHPAPYTMDTGFFLGVKRPGRDVDHPSYLAPRLNKE